MRIAVIGAGAMGSIYGGRLSLHHEVYIIDNNPQIVAQVNEYGLRIEEQGTENIYHPTAVISTDNLGPMDLVILFVKAIFSKAALDSNRQLIGPDTRLLTLQNGAGHEELLLNYATEEKIIIGTTEDNGAVLSPGLVRRGGSGITNIGMISEQSNESLKSVKEAFECCGFQVNLHENIRQLIWAKLLVNVSLSAVTGLLQVDMGYIADNQYAWQMTQSLIREAVNIAAAAGLSFDAEAVSEKIKATAAASPYGCTSIRADLRDGRRTEVDTISGAVVKTAKQLGVNAPLHNFVTQMIHAMEAIPG